MGRVLPANQFAPRACSRTPAPSIDARRAHDVTANMNDAEVERQVATFVAQGVSSELISEIDRDGDGRCAVRACEEATRR